MGLSRLTHGLSLHLYPNFQPNPMGHDQVLWSISPSSVFNVTAIWNALRSRAPKVHWYHLTWFPMFIPRHCFIFWMAFKGCLRTKDKIIKWGIQTCPLCPLCNFQNEDINHLLFSCPFSRTIWQKVCLLSKPLQTCENEVNWLIGKFSGKCFPNITWKLAWAAMVHYIWQERNCRVFQGIQISPSLCSSKKYILALGFKALRSSMLNPPFSLLLYAILGRLVLGLLPLFLPKCSYLFSCKC